MNIDFADELKNLLCPIHNKKVKITTLGNKTNYSFCCHHLRAEFFRITNPNQKNESEQSDKLE